MAEFSKLVITNKGQALIAKIMTGIGNIEFTKVSASNEECVLEQLEALAGLSDVRQTVPISKISRTNNVAITIEAVFNNLELTEGYHMRALGLYAIDPDEGEILYAVTMEISGNCYMPAYNGIAVSEAYIKLVTTVGNSENVSLEVDLAAVVTVGDMNSLRKEIVKTYLSKTGDSSENIVTFESDDSKNATSWTDVSVMESKEKHKSLLEKVSTMFKNVRFLYKMLGDEDISEIADGTVTGILQELKQMLDGKVNITSILDTIEQVDANTTAKNIADALVIKALKAELTNSINQISSNLGWKVKSLDIPFVAVDQELVINAENFFDTQINNDVCLIIGIDTLSKTNVLVNVSVPIEALGFSYNGNNSNISYEGETYRYGNTIVIIARNIAGINIDSLKVISILYK